MIIFFLLIIQITNSFNVIHHVQNEFYKEIHPLLNPNEIKFPSHKELSSSLSEYTIVSLHDDKYYENVTWIIMITKDLENYDNCFNLTIEEIKEEIENDNCILYTSIEMTKHLLLKIGCEPIFGNVFLKPKKRDDGSEGCKKTVKVRKQNFYNDLMELIKTPYLNKTMKLLIPCFGLENIIVEKNYYYKKPKSFTSSPKTIENMLNNYYYNKNQFYYNKNFSQLINYPPTNEWKDLYKIRTTQFNAPWNLDRIDQRFGLDMQYTYNNDASDIVALIIDTGIYTDNVEFSGRAQFVINTSGDGNDFECNGHGYFYLIYKKKLKSLPLFFSIYCLKTRYGSYKEAIVP